MLAWRKCPLLQLLCQMLFFVTFTDLHTRTIFFHCVSYSKSFSVLSVHKTSIYKIYCMEQFIKENIPSASYLVGISSEHSSTVSVTRSITVGKRGQFCTFFFYCLSNFSFERFVCRLILIVFWLNFLIYFRGLHWRFPAMISQVTKTCHISGQ